ncbi:O-methyltransferase [Nocardia wallacei]|uniref:O-methyltransferase n=1 Tax=Nocardia wallacei TaxID=480035 RepID=UPI002456BBCA|nr:O-methyltransferase [Nocardia wallacei]
MTAGASKTVALTDALHEYMLTYGCPPDEVASDLIADTLRLGEVAEMQIPPQQGALLTMLARVLKARMIVEVGTFTGYSTLCLARGLRAGGQVITLDIREDWTSLAREAWARAGVADRIDVRLGRAIDTLALLPRQPVIDLAFVDADKVGYIDYWEQLVPRLRPGGMLVVDNVFYGGAVVNTAAEGNAAAIRAFNEHAAADPRTDVVMLPLADGVTLARKRDGQEFQ